VAVIAIHGVGQHISGASAEAVSSLLESIGREDGRAESNPNRPYFGFAVDQIEVPLRAVYTEDLQHRQANERYQNNWWTKLWGVFDERRGFLALQRQRGFDESAKDRFATMSDIPEPPKFDYEFMLTQLAAYEGEPDRNFTTPRLESQRRAGSTEPRVHIYDAHYSDLSKQQSTIVSFFFAFYQLLFHLGSLSLQAVYWAEAENTDDSSPTPSPEIPRAETVLVAAPRLRRRTLPQERPKRWPSPSRRESFPGLGVFSPRCTPSASARSSCLFRC
jgi:hypothetical protein